MVFRDLPPRKVLQVLSIGSWVTAAPGERLIERGKPVESFSLLVRRGAGHNDDHVLGQLGAGDLVGSALLMTGAVADVDAMTVAPARIVRWEAALERYLNANPETRNLFQRHLARLAGKCSGWALTRPQDFVEHRAWLPLRHRAECLGQRDSAIERGH